MKAVLLPADAADGNLGLPCQSSRPRALNRRLHILQGSLELHSGLQGYQCGACCWSSGQKACEVLKLLLHHCWLT